MSRDFTETQKGVCDVKGCAFIAVWSSMDDKFWIKWIFNNANSVVAMSSDNSTKNTVVVFNKSGANSKNNYYIGFVKYT